MKKLTPYQEDALDYSSNILLTANAGSGKTFVLSKRFVEILLNDEVELENIVAITFTDKAAGELNKKIADEIELRISVETNSKKLHKLESARRQLVSANISTIHSFCINVLREFSPEAEIDANFNPIDQSTSDELILLSIDESFNRLINDTEHEESLKYLIRFFGSKNILIRQIQAAIEQRKIIEQHIRSLYSGGQSGFNFVLNCYFYNYFNHFFQPKIDQGIENIKVINSFVMNKKPDNVLGLKLLPLIKNYDSCKNIYERITLLKDFIPLLLTKSCEVKNRGYLSWERDNFAKEILNIESLFEQIGPVLESDFSLPVHDEYFTFGQHFLRIYDYISEIYSNKKSEKGYLDFEDILLFTQKIIELDEVQEFLRKKFKYIMIDEYQDTNEIQYRIFMPILDHLRQGNLFVVGDEKQSIYMFRDAELEVFNRTKNEIGQLNERGKLLQLPHSFRMAPEIVLFTNKLFSRLFNNPDPLLNEVSYNELICAKAENEKSSIQFLLADETENITESELVSTKILEVVSNGSVELNEIGILCRKRDMFAELENAFVTKNIPYTVLGGKGFYQKQSISDIYNYLSFLINQDDDAALIGILRSPFYNISDNVIYEISLEDGNNYFEKLIKYSSTNKNLKVVIDSINNHLQLAYSTEVFGLIRKILADRSYWSVLNSKKNSAQELANVNKLLAIAREFSKKSFKNLYDFTIYLRDAIELMEDEGQAKISKEENTVKLITIHQAKGLEFKAVFLFGCNESSKDDSIKTRSMGIDKEFGFLIKVFLNGNYFAGPVTPHFVALYNFIHHQKNVAEIKRLLYVAVTRAMNYLFISASHKKNQSHRDSFFDLLQKGLQNDFSGDLIQLQGDIEFMKQDQEKFTFRKKKGNTEIRIIKEPVDYPAIVNSVADNVITKKYLLKKIIDLPKKEIISATKISMFSQCPVKYELTYELGYPSIYNIVKKFARNEYEFNSKEDEGLKNFSDVKGRVIHEVLKEDPKLENIESLVENYLTAEQINKNKILSQLKKNITDDLIGFRKSNIFNTLQSYSEFKNEYEIYSEEGDNYLYGIVDRLIFGKEKLIIMDYKTDDIKLDTILERATGYFQQLTFYAYILSKYFTDYHNYELQLVFIKHPDEIIIKKIDRDDMIVFQVELQDAINKIHKREYQANFKHCPLCHFAMEGNLCVKLQ
ncbi:MAG: UvrD-helicase domain-containing protein [Melioribacteraceae bacterium]|nr:UvrD-helicase domain-containing protein [Melioribacteraceae bacterium]